MVVVVVDMLDKVVYLCGTSKFLVGVGAEMDVRVREAW
jgi:hypothetical protein